tara:strand:+ start:227 stop:883 length:657 start_codon:yes stop_codon:yes gene_type:complete
MEGAPPGAEMLDPNTMQGAMAAQAAGAPQQLSEEPAGGMEFKNALSAFTDFDSDLDRWSGILDRSIERLFERQQRVVLEKAGGAKARKALSKGNLVVDLLMPQDIWDKQMEEDIRPVLNAIIKDATESHSEKSAEYSPPTAEDIVTHVNSQMDRIKAINIDSREAIAKEIAYSLRIEEDEHRLAAFKSALVGHFTNLLAKVRPQTAIDETRRAWNLAG